MLLDDTRISSTKSENIRGKQTDKKKQHPRNTPTIDNDRLISIFRPEKQPREGPGVDELRTSLIVEIGRETKKLQRSQQSAKTCLMSRKTWPLQTIAKGN